MIDPGTRARLRLIEGHATVNGRDLFEDLDRAKLLATQERLTEAQIFALHSALQQLAEQPTQAIVNLGGGQNTAADAHRGAVEFLNFIISQFERRGR
jgi:hypothetical protein